jgi:hypothetical protein
MADDWALDTLVKKASKPNKKITKASQLICVHSLPIKCLCVGVGSGYGTSFKVGYGTNSSGPPRPKRKYSAEVSCREKKERERKPNTDFVILLMTDG